MEYKYNMQEVAHRIQRAMIGDYIFGPLWVIQVILRPLGKFGPHLGTLAHRSGLPTYKVFYFAVPPRNRLSIKKSLST